MLVASKTMATMDRDQLVGGPISTKLVGLPSCEVGCNEFTPEEWMVGRQAFPFLFGFRSRFRGELLNFGGVPFFVVVSQIYMLNFSCSKTLSP